MLVLPFFYVISDQTTQGKEIDSWNVIKQKIYTPNHTRKNSRRTSPSLAKKRASICTSVSGSVTIEAALAVPLFFFALIAILYLLEIMAVQCSINVGMHYAIEQLVEEVGTSYYVSDSEIEELIVEGVGAEKLENSIIVGGSSGLDCSESSVSALNGIVELSVCYEVELPVPKFGFPSMNFQETMVAKGWTGYVEGVVAQSDEIVYITDNASVYHVDYNCTYLQLSISSTTYAALDNLRNAYGGIYGACAICVDSTKEWSDNEGVYITENGDCYHSTLSCSGLTRTIHAVSITEVIGKGVCSRCGS